MKNPTKISINFSIDFLMILAPFGPRVGLTLGAKIRQNEAMVKEGGALLRRLRAERVQGYPQTPKMGAQGHPKIPKWTSKNVSQERQNGPFWHP